MHIAYILLSISYVHPCISIYQYDWLKYSLWHLSEKMSVCQVQAMCEMVSKERVHPSWIDLEKKLGLFLSCTLRLGCK